jgi:hypothetical protein
MIESDIMNPIKFTKTEAEKLLPSNLKMVKPFKNRPDSPELSSNSSYDSKC